MNARAGLLTLACLLFTPLWPECARAADAPRGGGREGAAQPIPSRALLDQKASLLQRLIADSPMAQRIHGSENAPAKTLMAEAAQRYQQALPLLQANDLARADALLTEGIALIGKARKLVPDASARELEYRARYLQLVETTQSLSQAYERRWMRGSAEPRRRIDAGRNQSADALARAQALGEQGRYREAVLLLEGANAQLMREFTAMLGTDALEGTPRFASPAEEFEYELERNREYAMLVPIALAELKPAAQARENMEAHVRDSAALRRAASEQAGRREFPAALNSLRQSTALLQQALSVAGLVVPASEAVVR